MKKIFFSKSFILPAVVLFLVTSFFVAKSASAITLPTPGTAIYDSIPNPQPGSSPSVGFQATQTAELGDNITFAGTDRTLVSVDVMLNSWACQTGAWNTNDCANPNTENLGFTHPITLNIYNVDNSGPTPVAGSLITTVTQNILVPWRPATDPSCANGGYNFPTCTSGYNFTTSFSIPNVVVPNEVIYGVSFNTQSWGPSPIGVDGPYNSLNVSVPNVTPSIGTDNNPDALFWNTHTASNYTDNGLAGIDTFRQDTGWATYVPAARFNAITEQTGGNLTITAHATGGDATFGMVGFLVGGNFDITTVGGTGSKTFNDLTPGLYNITVAQMPPGWDITGFTCSSHIVVTAGGNSNCTFNFSKQAEIAPYSLVLSKSGDGYGTLIPSPLDASGTFCGNDECNQHKGQPSKTAYYAPGTALTFTATPDANSQIAGWIIGGQTNSCGTNSTCSFTLDVSNFILVVFSPKPQEQECDANAGLTFVSDTSTTVDGHDAVAVTPHPAWTSIPGATWIYNQALNEAGSSPTGDKTFTKTFIVTGTPLDSSLDIAADNMYTVSINGNPLNTGTSGTNLNNFTSSSTWTIPAALLTTGINTMTITVTNPAVDPETQNPFGDPNPGGLLFKINLNENECITPDPIDDTPPGGGPTGGGGLENPPVNPPADVLPPPIGGGNGQVLGASTGPSLEGRVLGATTCSVVYLHKYIYAGNKNDPAEVKLLQAFLNKNLGINLKVDGVYGKTSRNAVIKFQEKYQNQILAPWTKIWVKNDGTRGTGIVYKTTLWWINMLNCADLNLPTPQLP